LSASEAPDPGRHHVGTPGDIISECPGDFVGIRSYGLAGAVIVEPSAYEHPDAKGEIFWGGRAGTQWWISAKTNTAGLIMAQREMGHTYVGEFKRLAYEAVRANS
jgi:hypothetical protein